VASPLLSNLLDMMRLRSGPQNLPPARQLMLALVVAYAGQAFVADWILGEPAAAPRTLLAITVQFTIIMSLLNARRLSARINQTISALAGTGFLFGAMSIAMLSQADPDQPQAALALLYLGLFLWSLFVDAHIYRQALSIRMNMGMLVAVLIFGVNYFLLRAVFE
jgi:hypothetical protein